MLKCFPTELLHFCWVRVAVLGGALSWRKITCCTNGLLASKYSSTIKFLFFDFSVKNRCIRGHARRNKSLPLPCSWELLWLEVQWSWLFLSPHVDCLFWFRSGMVQPGFMSSENVIHKRVSRFRNLTQRHSDACKRLHFCAGIQRQVIHLAHNFLSTSSFVIMKKASPWIYHDPIQNLNQRETCVTLKMNKTNGDVSDAVALSAIMAHDALRIDSGMQTWEISKVYPPWTE